VPIPGTKRRRYLEDNIGALDVTLTDDDRARIDRILPPGAATGTRYAAPQMASLGR
jgi:aryl-alcohol dehydrogenase-like predicted oxidoreductase